MSEEKTKLTFGEAIEALKNGKKVARKGWNGKGMFNSLHRPAFLPPQARKKGDSA